VWGAWARDGERAVGGGCLHCSGVNVICLGDLDQDGLALGGWRDASVARAALCAVAFGHAPQPWRAIVMWWRGGRALPFCLWYFMDLSTPHDVGLRVPGRCRARPVLPERYWPQLGCALCGCPL